MLIAALSGLLAAAVPVNGMHFVALSDASPPAVMPGVPASRTMNPSATAALERMGRYLQMQPFLSVKATAWADHMLRNGQKVQLDFSVQIWVRRPDNLRVDVTADRATPTFSRFYFDGKTFTAFGQNSGQYAKASLPATLSELPSKLSDQHGLRLPLVDLFTWAGGADHLARLTGATTIGLTTVGGQPCDQYAFRQDGLDWQLWIQRGTQPLPRRLVLTSTVDADQTQQSVELDWAQQDSPSASLFVFEPPAGAQEIPMPRSNETAEFTP
ncbi:DUF2092 domain-containing protein [Caldimonas brevitalea]|uniref:DUF2092 domain-containing protein n=1 Tax=Caldimonas brevitalea TaxID=413882 RepID=A0A0G3BMX1_9BURK|nr:DUF2092 domain-containing protein [Caldimonas brevitalea]AKJ29313.1 hypothetical protein AAW51_2622 [Caldimonas brevitalea]